MAPHYSVVSQQRSVKVIGPTQVRDVQLVGFVTVPTGIYLEYPIYLDEWRLNEGRETLSTLASGVEQQIAGGPAVGGSYVQDYDKNGLLTDYIEMTVEYVPPGGLRPAQTTGVLIPLDSFLAAVDSFFAGLSAAPQNVIAEAYDHLVATANL